MPLGMRFRVMVLRRQPWWPCVVAVLVLVGKWLQGDPSLFPYPGEVPRLPRCLNGGPNFALATLGRPQSTLGPAGIGPDLAASGSCGERAAASR